MGSELLRPMTPFQAAIGYAGTAFMFATLVGLIARQRYREWWSFSLYLLFDTVYALLIAVWPERFHRPAPWMLNESISSLLRFVAALELAYRTFRGFPGAMARLRVVLLTVIGFTLAVVLAATPARLDYMAFMGHVHPRVVNGSVWLFTAIAALILWYRLPVRLFSKRILLSWVPYLLVFAVAMNGLGAIGWERGLALDYLRQVAYLALVAYWAYAAWQPARLPVFEPARVTAGLP